MTKRIKVIVPIPMDAAGVAARAQQLPPDMVRAGFEPEFVAVPWGAALGDSYHDMLLMDWTVFQAGIKAEEEGYDAVCIDTVSDSGMYALRSRLSIPVLGPGQIAFHTAMTLGKKFTILTMWKEWFPLYTKTLAEYGIENRVASIRHINTRPDVTELLEGKEEIVFDALKLEAEKAIAQDGADVIVLGSTTMHQSAKFLADTLPIPVINPGVITYKLCEVLLDLGLTHSKLAFPNPEVPADSAVLASKP